MKPSFFKGFFVDELNCYVHLFSFIFFLYFFVLKLFGKKTKYVCLRHFQDFFDLNLTWPQRSPGPPLGSPVFQRHDHNT